MTEEYFGTIEHKVWSYLMTMTNGGQNLPRIFRKEDFWELGKPEKVAEVIRKMIENKIITLEVVLKQPHFCCDLKYIDTNLFESYNGYRFFEDVLPPKKSNFDLEKYNFGDMSEKQYNFILRLMKKNNYDKNDEFFVAIEKTLNGEATDYPFLKAEASKRIEILMGKNKEGK